MSINEALLAAAGVSSGPVEYVEDVFATHVYRGTITSINNGIDLSGKGGLVWIKSRSTTSGITDHALFDTARGVSSGYLSSNTTGAASNTSGQLTAFNNDGFTLGDPTSPTINYIVNESFRDYCSWTFRKASKFFDVVTYTGDGNANRSISHNLGSTPGMVIVKQTSNPSVGTNWRVFHRSATGNLLLNTTGTQAPGNYGIVSVSSTNFVVQVDSSNYQTNANGETYVAYLFAHDAGGFGAAGTDNIITCGLFTADDSGNASVDLGYEPQFLLTKTSNVSGNWQMLDVNRGMNVTRAYALSSNLSNAEEAVTSFIPNARGFSAVGVLSPGNSYIYMAIRRPMKVPTTGTEVFSTVARTGTGVNATVSSGFVTDTVIEGNRTSTTTISKFGVWDRLRDVNYTLTRAVSAEAAGSTSIIQINPWDVMNGYKVGTTSVLTNTSGAPFINWMFKRAPGFLDVICYQGTGVNPSYYPHNLGVIPELTFVKRRNASGNWRVATLAGIGNQLVLNSPAAYATATSNNGIGITATDLELYGGLDTSASGGTYVAYLFASCPGVSKIGSYTGTGGVQTINCGFSAGARFVLIKRTDAVGDWYVWDTARGIIAGNDPYLFLNLANAEVTNTDFIDADPSGFQISSTAPVGVNAPAGTSWTLQTTGGAGNLRCIAYGNGTYVVAGNSRLMYTSTNASSWTSRTSGFNGLNIQGISFGNGTFVIVGASGSVSTSTDGITWADQTSGTTQELNGITYGNGIFVTVGSTGTILTSPDGVTWTAQTSGTTTALNAITYVNGMYIAVGDGGVLLTSSDAITWTAQTSGFGTVNINGVTYGNGVFVAVGDSGNLKTSPDGVTWTAQTSGFSTNSIYSVSYAVGTFIITGANGRLSTSPDGVTWTSQTTTPLNGTGTAPSLFASGYGNGVFLTCGSNNDGSVLGTSVAPNYIYLAIA